MLIYLSILQWSRSCWSLSGIKPRKSKQTNFKKRTLLGAPKSEKNSQTRSTRVNYKLLRMNKLSPSLNFDIAIYLTVWLMRRVIFSLLVDLNQASESHTTDRSSTASKSLRLNESGNCGNKRDCGKLRFILGLFMQFKTRLSLFEPN